MGSSGLFKRRRQRFMPFCIRLTTIKTSRVQKIILIAIDHGWFYNILRIAPKKAGAKKFLERICFGADANLERFS